MGRKVQWKYQRNPHQQQFHTDVVSKYLHLSGGFGCGKTYGLCQKAIQLSWLNKDIPGGFVAPDFADFEKDVLPTMEEIMNAHKVKFTYRAGRYFKFPWTKAPLYLVSAKKRIRGPNWGYALINELTLIPYMRYKEIIGRVRVKRAKFPQIASSGTPEGFGTDYHKNLIKTPFATNVRVIFGSTRANAHNLNPDYIQSLTASYDKAMLDAYLEGLFVNMTGNRFYYAYDTKNENVNIQRDPELDVHCCIDFNVQFMTATFWHYIGGRLKAFDEICIENNADTNKMCRAMIDRGYMPDSTIIYPDPSGNSRSTKGRSDVEIIKQNGFHRVIATKAPAMRTRQLNVNNLLDKKIIEINPLRCPTLQDDFLGVTQDPGTNEKIKSNPRLTHASDGVDYMVDHLFPFSGKRSGVLITTAR